MGTGSNHLQLIKFWQSCAPGKGFVAGKNFGSALLQLLRTLCVYGGTAAGAQCLRLSERFFIAVCFCKAIKLVYYYYSILYYNNYIKTNFLF